MFITKKHLSRRTVLRGLGVTVALPLLDSMIPAQTPLAKTAANPVPHMGFIYFPHGAVMNLWTPSKEGTDFGFPKIVKPLEPFRKQITIVSGMGNRAAESAAVHAITPGTWLSGVAPRPTHEPYAGVTIDQIAAQHMGQDTPLPSLELTTEEAYLSGGGSCDRDYGCSYSSSISFRTPTTPLPMEHDPRKVFERLFGQGKLGCRDAKPRPKSTAAFWTRSKKKPAACNARWPPTIADGLTIISKASAKLNAASRGSKSNKPSGSICPKFRSGYPTRSTNTSS